MAEPGYGSRRRPIKGYSLPGAPSRRWYIPRTSTTVTPGGLDSSPQCTDGGDTAENNQRLPELLDKYHQCFRLVYSAFAVKYHLTTEDLVSLAEATIAPDTAAAQPPEAATPERKSLNKHEPRASLTNHLFRIRSGRTGTSTRNRDRKSEGGAPTAQTRWRVGP